MSMRPRRKETYDTKAGSCFSSNDMIEFKAGLVLDPTTVGVDSVAPRTVAPGTVAPGTAAEIRQCVTDSMLRSAVQETALKDSALKDSALKDSVGLNDSAGVRNLAATPTLIDIENTVRNTVRSRMKQNHPPAPSIDDMVRSAIDKHTSARNDNMIDGSADHIKMAVQKAMAAEMPCVMQRAEMPRAMQLQRSEIPRTESYRLMPIQRQDIATAVRNALKSEKIIPVQQSHTEYDRVASAVRMAVSQHLPPIDENKFVRATTVRATNSLRDDRMRQMLY
ncbi:hypothetical protein T484DRAFT_3634087 [Baffinella frigidus]|nr:hypothetical protein T484DRAFT_3634087 [Cryptophyta sp. CCMP2293]